MQSWNTCRIGEFAFEKLSNIAARMFTLSPDDEVKAGGA
jgi:hypothetical protein